MYVFVILERFGRSDANEQSLNLRSGMERTLKRWRVGSTSQKVLCIVRGC